MENKTTGKVKLPPLGQVGVVVLEHQLPEPVLGEGRQVDLAVPGQLDQGAEAQRSVQVDVEVGLRNGLEESPREL